MYRACCKIDGNTPYFFIFSLASPEQRCYTDRKFILWRFFMRTGYASKFYFAYYYYYSSKK